MVEVEAFEKTANDLLTPRRARDQERLAQQQAEAQKQQSARRRRATDPPMAPLLPPPVQEVRIKSERSPIVEYLYDNWHQSHDILLMVSFVPFLVYFMLSWRITSCTIFCACFTVSRAASPPPP